MAKAARGSQTNAEIARHLTAMAQQLRAKNENPFKVRAYYRAAETIAGLSDSIAEQVHANADLTRYAGIGDGIAKALKEIVLAGSLGQLELLLAQAPPEVAALREYPKLDAKRVLRAYKKLGISTVDLLRERLVSGELGKVLGPREEQHFKAGMAETTEILLVDAEPVVESIHDYLVKKGGAVRAEVAGAFRRRVEVIGELCFVVEVPDWDRLVKAMERYGGGTALTEKTETTARFKLSNGVALLLQRAPAERWGLGLLSATGSAAHLAKLEEVTKRLAKVAQAGKALADEEAAYRALGLPWIPPELREGGNEVALAKKSALPDLVGLQDIRGDLHAHTTSSDGWHTIEQMAEAAKALGYEYLGITDHSQSLKIARGVSEENLWAQIRVIDALNEKDVGIRILKSAEVDILVDGRLDYPDDLLAELDYTVCSIHSQFRKDRTEQTERIIRAMDNPHFGFLGHATGRLLLKRRGYEFDLEKVIAHAADLGRGFEINASPDRLDLSSESARMVGEAGIMIAVNTDAHHTEEFKNMRLGLDVARRAGLMKHQILNALPLKALLKAFAP